jgi:hypothetical protein
MAQFKTFAFVILATVAAAPAAWAFGTPNANAPYSPTENQIDSRYADNQIQPYAMSYSEEAAQKLGVQDGKWEAFDTHSTDPLVPSLKGGVDSGAAMIKLQWTPD